MRDCSACGGTGGQLHDGALLRTARKEHFCGGHHDGDRHLRCGEGGKSGTIPRGQVYVEWMDSAPVYGSGVRYHWHCAITQGIVDLCPVCLGSGRISDVRTARDAMVDADMAWPLMRAPSAILLAAAAAERMEACPAECFEEWVVSFALALASARAEGEAAGAAKEREAVSALSARVEELERLMAETLEAGIPIMSDSSMNDVWCYFCEAEAGMAAQIEHSSGCLWTRLRRALAPKEVSR
jgi:hypothetical protein